MEDYRRQKMVFYLHIQKKKRDEIIILTEDVLLLLVNADLKRSLTVSQMTGCEVYRVKEKFMVRIESASEDLLIVEAEEYFYVKKIYSAINTVTGSLNEKVN